MAGGKDKGWRLSRNLAAQARSMRSMPRSLLCVKSEQLCANDPIAAAEACSGGPKQDKMPAQTRA